MIRVVDPRRWRTTKRATCGLLLTVSLVLSGSTQTGLVGWMVLGVVFATDIYAAEHLRQIL